MLYAIRCIDSLDVQNLLRICCAFTATLCNLGSSPGFLATKGTPYSVCDDKLCVWRPEPSDMKELESRGIYVTYLEGSFHWLGKACHNYGHLNAVQLEYGQLNNPKTLKTWIPGISVESTRSTRGTSSTSRGSRGSKGRSRSSYIHHLNS